MPSILFRPLPWIVGGLGLLLSWLQWKFPLTYPWPLLALLIAYLAAGGIYAYGRLKFLDAAGRLLPTALFIISASLSFLVIEQPLIRTALTLAVAFVPFFSLDLLYLALCDPARYPVNGLSRLNLALAPSAIFLLTIGLGGLQVFLRIQPWIALLALPFLAAVFFLVTSHPTADQAHRSRWTGIGAIAGFKAAALSLALPLALPVQGALAALIVALPLRVRRYGYAPAPSRRQAIVETCLHLGCFLLLLLVSRWA